MVVPNNRPPAVDVAQVIVQNLAGIGINVNLQEVTAAQRNQLIANTAPTDPAYPALQYMTVAGPPDPDNWVSPIVGPSGRGVGVFNSAQYTNAQVDALVAQQSLTVNNTQRALLEGKIISLVNNDLPYYWIAQFQNAYLTGVPLASTHVQGFSSNPVFVGDSVYDFSTLYITS
jgi:ABC-type transport system substrate-binding protein